MTLKNIIGIDHAVVAVTDLDAAAVGWRHLGFTISPRGTHSAIMGTGNYTIMLGDDYIELIGVLAETPLNAPTRAYLARSGGGVERIAFTTLDAAAGSEEIRARGLIPVGPNDFERPVTLPNGGQSEARFRTFLWPVDQAPGGLRIFACQHKTRDTVWIPELQQHANTATSLKRVLSVSPEPANEAQHLARMIDSEIHTAPDGALLVQSGPDRAEFAFLTRDRLALQYPGVPLAGLPERGGAGLVIAVQDLAAARRSLGANGIESHGAVVVPPKAANNALLAFEAW